MWMKANDRSDDIKIESLMKEEKRKWKQTIDLEKLKSII
jgi:predicted GIY-YIG superfamily endonuclease